jgi:chromosome segregation ATPase
MNRHAISAIGWAGLIGVGWLAFSRFPNLAYMTTDYSAITGWDALRAGWPVYGLLGLAAVLAGLALGGWMGENAREHASEERAVKAEERAVLAENAAQNAQEAAEAALAEKMRRAELREREASAAIAAAKGAREAADAEAQRATSRVADLERERAELQMQRDNAIASTHRRRRRIQRLEAQLEQVVDIENVRQ